MRDHSKVAPVRCYDRTTVKDARDTPGWVRILTRVGVPKAQRQRFATLLKEYDHGYDSFGAHRDGAAFAHAFTRFLYERWFRVQSHGHENIPASGPVIIAANHSGTLPFDAMMIYADLLRRTDPPRLPRAIADSFVAGLPWVGLLFARAGVVGGARRNVEHLLRRDELVVVFPEGVPGISKRYAQRYRLQTWRGGHAELAIRFGATVVPTALIGAEEQMPQVARLPVSLFGAPFLPIPATPVPLPVRYHIHYGKPIRFDLPKSASDDPSAIADASAQVRDAVRDLLDEGLRQRKGRFV